VSYLNLLEMTTPEPKPQCYKSRGCCKFKTSRVKL